MSDWAQVSTELPVSMDGEGTGASETGAGGAALPERSASIAASGSTARTWAAAGIAARDSSASMAAKSILIEVMVRCPPEIMVKRPRIRARCRSITAMNGDSSAFCNEPATVRVRLAASRIRLERDAGWPKAP